MARFILFLVLSLSLNAEKRFDRDVMKLADPKAYKTYKLDDNTFPYLERNGLAVSSMVYRGTKYYYVEVAINNSGDQPVAVSSPDFVQFTKPGYTVFPIDTAGPIGDIRIALGQTFVPTPPPPPTSATTTTNGTATTYGNTTTLNATSTTRVDNSAAAWHNLGQALAARSFYNSVSVNERFMGYLTAFAHEQQDGMVKPKEAKIFTFTFQQLKPKKAPFSIRVTVGSEVFEFKYKE